MESLKKYFLLAIGVVILVWSLILVLNQPAPAKYQRSDLSQPSPSQGEGKGEVIRIGDKEIFIEIANTDASRTQGLSGRASLASHTGLLFIFDEPGQYGFWMKDMHFPIDIIWIDENWLVVGVEREVAPNTFPQIFEPISPIKYVLEINSGEASRLGIDTGSRLIFDSQK